MKRIKWVVLLAAAGITAAGCGGGKGPKTSVWKLAFNQSIEHPQATALLWLGEQFEQQTNGAYKIDVNPNELLGNQKEAFESVQTGVIHLAVLANSIIETVNPDFALIALPGLYSGVQHQQNVFTSGVLNELFGSTAKNNFYVLAGLHAGVRNVYAKKPVRSPADLDGMKIRVMQSQLMIDVIEAMGGVAVPMSHGEVYTAIQQGVLDGAENNEVTYWDSKHYEVAPVYSYTKHFMIPDILVINKKAYDGLEAQHKTVFDKLMRETIKREFQSYAEEAVRAKQNAIQHGVKFVEDFDANVFAANFKTITDQFLSTPERKKLYAAIQAAAKN